MDMAKVKRESLGRADWAEAALEALARGGVSAVAVEPLAKALHTTKGSFYWHFADRNALLEATLGLWEQRDTERVMANLSETDPLARLRDLLRLAFRSVNDGADGATGTVELALQASASLPLVAAALQRVTTRRLELMTQLYVELGLFPEVARGRALLAYTAYLGHAQLAHSTPAVLPRGRALRQHVDRLVESLVDLGD
ncbi:TetR-type regulator [metagenome]|uniref:TetR-type regulator n=1 Tax=metagenome TaxID=256318 RepID=A0A2P2C2D4_9ZZZZ